MIPETLKRVIGLAEKCFIVDLETFKLKYDDKLLSKLKDVLVSNFLSNLWKPIFREAIFEVRERGLGGRRIDARNIEEFANSIVESSLLFLQQKYFPGVYFFRINPNMVSYGTKKLVNVYRYGFGSFDVQYFGNDLMSVTIEGRVGALIPPFPLPQVNITDIRLSIPYMKLVELEYFFKDRSPAIIFGILERFYYGFLMEFGYTMKAEDPFNISYRLVANLHPNRYWYRNVLMSGMQDFDIEVQEELNKVSDKPILFYFGE